MKIKAFVVIDTNIIISASLKGGFPRDVLDLVDTNNIIPIFDNRMLNEYYEVLNRSHFKFSEQNKYDSLFPIVYNGIMINDVEEAKILLNDVKDLPFFEVKESSEELSSYLVTGNIKHFPASSTTVTPKELINILETLEKFVSIDFNYERNVEQLKEMQLLTPKYSSGKEFLDKMFDIKTKTIKKSYFERD